MATPLSTMRMSSCTLLNRYRKSRPLVAVYRQLTHFACRTLAGPSYITQSSPATALFSSSSHPNDIFKRAKLELLPRSDNVIGTHSGAFQADEAMGCWMLRQLPAYRNAKIVRTRDVAVLNSLSIVIDVGDVYDHAKLRYDHHQRGYDERLEELRSNRTTDPRCTKLSACGLVYRHYGKEVIQQFYPNLPQALLDLAYVRLYNSLLEALDAIDTGVELVLSDELVYRDTTGLSARVKRLNPRWNEVDETTGHFPNSDDRFEAAIDMCGKDFMSVMTRIVESDMPARGIVTRAVLHRKDVCPTGKIITLPSDGIPWKKYLYGLEKIHGIDPIKFVIYQCRLGMWRVRAVTIEGRAFDNRLLLPKKWRGCRDKVAQKITKINGARFVHASGFTGGADSFEGALKMAQVALEQDGH